MSRIENYLNNKSIEFIERFGEEHINRYNQLYEPITTNEGLEILFSITHYELNRLFKFMNSRLRNGHYTANESRELIYLIEELRTIQSNIRDTEFSFELHSYYQEKITEMEDFLSENGGSTIPNNFEKINIIELEPLFILTRNISVTRNIKTELFTTKQIGGGSYATVHKYKDKHYNRHFAIKRADRNLTETEYNRFRLEFETMKDLNSPYVVEVFRFDDDKREYIMEYVDETLQDFISRNNNKLSNDERISLVRQIFRAFIYINNKNVLHRDISTKNILIKKYDELNVIKVADFGYVKLPDSELTRKNTKFRGSFNDPKLEIIGFEKYNERHETYALTRIIYFVMTGRTTMNKFPNKEFEVFVNKGISDDINERYGNVIAMQEAFNRIAKSFY